MPVGGQDLPHPSRSALGPTKPSLQWIPGLFPVGKVAGAWCSTPSPSMTDVKERVQFHLYSPFGHSWSALGKQYALLLLLLALVMDN